MSSDATIPALSALALLAALAGVPAGPARAEEPPAPASPQPRQEAEPAQEAVDHDAVFRRGLGRYEAGDHLGAIAIWERLLQTLGDQRGWRVLYNLGLAYQAVGDVTRAIDRYELFLRRIAEQPSPAPGIEERRQDAAERVQALKAAYGAVHVRAPGTGDVVLVRVGAAEPRPAGFTVYLAPGDHRVELHSGTPRARWVKVQVAAGEGVTIEVSLPKQPTPSAPPPKPPAQARPSFPTGWVIAGAGLTAASAALPIALGLRAQGKRDSAEELGTRHKRYPEELESFRDARTLYYMSYAVPAVLAAATGTIAIVGAVRASSPGVQIGVAAGTGSAGVTLGGTF